MDKKTFSIGILSATALVLLIANLLPLQKARADEAVKERDFTLVTSRIAQGGDALYVVDNRTGKIAIFTWDVQARTVRLQDMKPITDVFHE